MEDEKRGADLVSDEVRRVLEHQQYRLVGRHSAVKLCHWLKHSLRGKGVCYKQQFYGIRSHRCLQFTPVVNWCNQACRWAYVTVITDRQPDSEQHMDTLREFIAALYPLVCRQN